MVAFILRWKPFQFTICLMYTWCGGGNLEVDGTFLMGLKWMNHYQKVSDLERGEEFSFISKGFYLRIILLKLTHLKSNIVVNVVHSLARGPPLSFERKEGIIPHNISLRLFWDVPLSCILTLLCQQKTKLWLNFLLNYFVYRLLQVRPGSPPRLGALPIPIAIY